MMNRFKKILIVLLTITLLLPFFPVSVIAKEIPSDSDEPSQVTTITETYINPLYQDVIDVDDLNDPYDSNISSYNVSEYYSSINEASAYMCSQMTQRSETIEIGFQKEITEEESDQEKLKSMVIDTGNIIANNAFDHTGNSIEGDYLLWQYAGWKCNISYYTQEKICYITYTYTMTYYTTADQESELDTMLESVMNQLDLDDKTNYEKIKCIYDYICNNITYDYENLEDNDYTLKYTAYAALINKTAVCQGYAVLFYRMSLEAGIDARFIAGTGNNSPHGWNIVQMEESYYNLDSTWDAGKTTYEYFMRCNDNFPDHTRNNDYDNDEFNNLYPMGNTDYQPSPDNPLPENPFTDINENDYYYDAVLWAYQNGIVNGIDDTHFGPSNPCTRAQSAAFLWRSNNEPEPSTSENPFEDIVPSDYFYKAVLWAYENGITSGKDETHFQPNATVTRKEFVTFLWRSVGKPEPVMTENPFLDVPNDQYYTKAVLWAYENNITTGTDATHFQPDNPCIRAQIVSFLYRFFN